jgi:hypothetical protein
MAAMLLVRCSYQPGSVGASGRPRLALWTPVGGRHAQWGREQNVGQAGTEGVWRSLGPWLQRYPKRHLKGAPSVVPVTKGSVLCMSAMIIFGSAWEDYGQDQKRQKINTKTTTRFYLLSLGTHFNYLSCNKTMCGFSQRSLFHSELWGIEVNFTHPKLVVPTMLMREPSWHPAAARVLRKLELFACNKKWTPR